MQYWINRGKAEANQKAIPAKIVEKTPEEIAKSKAYKECAYEASKATVGMSNSEGIASSEYFAVRKRVAEQELEKQCLSVKGFK